MLRTARAAGVLPKARTAYALFLQQCLKEYGSKAKNIKEHQTRISRAGARWRKLTPQQKEKFNEQAAEELRQRKEALQEMQAPNMEEETPTPKPHEPSVKVPVTNLGKWIVEERLGHGGYGNAFVVRHQTTGVRAAAKLWKEEGESSRDELNIYLALREAPDNFCKAFFLPLLQHCIDAPMEWMVMPWQPMGSLRTQIKSSGPLKPKEVKAVLCQGAVGLNYLHCLGFLHLDVKPANLLWCPARHHMQIIDFSLSCVFPLKRAREDPVGTPSYRAPEAWNLPVQIGPFTDSFAMGCVAFEAATGDILFHGSTKEEIKSKIMKLSKRGEVTGKWPLLGELRLTVWKLVGEAKARPDLKGIATI
ncbi:Smok [Symbiodinium natans]|uniref:non-specific serine/threonine protein kinase n=1 Tax=Symbiodinium natans TaxID=878477 RepID=A0A812I376_9DINO|nr:Smok [Symbiodinium natans]